MLLLAALFVLPLAMNAQSGVYFTENFEAASTTWTQTGTHWQLSTANSYGFGTRCFNMPHSSRGATDTLISPVIDLSTATNPQLSFYHIQKEWAGDQDELHVLYRTSATGAWTSLAAFTSDVQAWTEEIIALTGVTSSTVQLGFAGVDNYGHGLFLDSIVVSESPSCPSINGIIVNGATVASASLSWTVSAAPATVPGGYSVVYSVNGDTSSEMTMTATTNSMVLTGLTPGTAYKVVVTPDCGTDGLGRGDTTYLTTTALTCMEIDTANSLIVGAMDNSHGNTTAYFPNYTYYNYSYAQQFYTPADIIGEGDSISGMTIEVASGSATRNIKVYLANAPAAASLASGLIAFDSATFVNVFSGSVTFEEGTVAVPFSQNFYYNGTGNIVLTVIDVTSAWTQSPSRYYTPSANIMAHIVYSDTYNYDGGQNTANGTMQTLNGRANVVLQKSVCAQLSYCANPIVTVDTTEENSIAVSWTAGYQEDNWDVNYRVQGTEAWTLAEHTTNLASTIGNLTSNTIYEIQIMTPCGDNTVVTAITRCGSIARSAMPVTETFESYSDRDTIRCWNILGNVAATSYDAVYPHASASAGHSSGFGLDIMYNVDDARGNEVGAMFPQFEVGIDSIDVTFDAKANYSGHYDPITFEYVYDTVPGQLLFGVCDDRMGTNFVVLDTFNLTNRWDTYTFSTNAHQDDLGDAMYVGFKSMTSDSTGSDHISMDNVVFEIHSNCLSPVAISIDSSTFTYFNVDVTYTEDPMTEASEYEMKVGRVNDINNADTTFAVLGSPVALTNIVAETDYYVWMRSVCGDLGGRWFGPFHFRTPAACSAVENLQYFYNQTSNSVSRSWNTSRLGNPINGFVVRYRCDDTAVTRVYTSDFLVTLSGLQELASYEVTVASICGDDTSAAQRVEFNTGKCNVVAIGQMGTSYVPTYTYYNYSYAQEIYLASEMTSLDDTIRGVAFFNGSANAPSGRNITVYMGQTDQNTFGGTTGIVSDSLTVVYTDSVHTWNTGWDTITFTTPFVRNNSRNIVFAIDDNTGAYVASPIWLSQYSVGNGRVLYKFNDSSNPNPASPTGMTAGDYIPTAQFIANCVTPACVAPSVFATNASQNTVSLRWVAGGAETSWNVDYRISGTTAWNSAATAVTTTAYQVTGLTAGNNYEFRVSSQCGAESAATIVNAHTTCGLIAVPYRQNFEGLATGDFAINCWNAISSTYMMWGYEQTAYPYIENVPSFSNMVRLYHNTAVVLPATAAPPSTSCRYASCTRESTATT